MINIRMHKPFTISSPHGLWKNKPPLRAEISMGSNAMKTFRIQAITKLIAISRKVDSRKVFPSQIKARLLLTNTAERFKQELRCHFFMGNLTSKEWVRSSSLGISQLRSDAFLNHKMNPEITAWNSLPNRTANMTFITSSHKTQEFKMHKFKIHEFFQPLTLPIGAALQPALLLYQQSSEKQTQPLILLRLQISQREVMDIYKGSPVFTEANTIAVLPIFLTVKVIAILCGSRFLICFLLQ